jgi:hypothetical protein
MIFHKINIFISRDIIGHMYFMFLFTFNFPVEYEQHFD